MSTLLLIDGNAIIHRAFHALPPFKTKNGFSTNIIYGFFSMLYKAVSDFKPDQIIICFDTPKPTFRDKIFKEYRAQRPKAPDEFKEQIPGLKEGLKKAGIFYLEKEGFEADDIIASIAKKATEESKVLILTGDKDIMQLVDSNIIVASPQKGLTNITLYGIEKVKEKFGVEPEKIAELKALMGDPSDNYPGAKGIGPKTAAELIVRFGTVENLLQNINQIESPKIREIITREKENIIMSKKLALLDSKIDLKIDKKEYSFQWFKEELKEFFDKYEIKSLKERIFNNNSGKKKNTSDKQEKKDDGQIGLF